MRLLQRCASAGFSFTKSASSNDATPPYAILSHTWGDDDQEVTFDDIINGTGQHKLGYEKIRFCAAQAEQDGVGCFWIDTCCIDKSSSSELSFSINSMFKWYKEASFCYAYLSDAESEDLVDIAEVSDSKAQQSQTNGDDEKCDSEDNQLYELLKSKRWFSRGWTLQELLAPDNVMFFDENWRKIGEKADPALRRAISRITKIEEVVLQKSFQFKLKSLRSGDQQVSLWSTSMRWSSDRKTTRPEDAAYCLMGIFDVHMPLLYGEGLKAAFWRLQKKLLKRVSSNSLLAWDLDSSLCIGPNVDVSKVFTNILEPLNILAVSPRVFLKTPTFETVRTFSKQASDYKAWVVSNRGIELETLLITDETWFEDEPIGVDGIYRRYELAIAVLPFRLTEDENSTGTGYAGFLLAGNAEQRVYYRIRASNGKATVKISARLAAKARLHFICITENEACRQVRTPSARSKTVFLDCCGFQVRRTLLRGCTWNSADRSVMFPPDTAGGRDFQEALLELALEDSPDHSFYVLLSNSKIRHGDLLLHSQPSSERWHFQELGIVGIGNTLGQSLFEDNWVYPREGSRFIPRETPIKIAMGDHWVHAGLSEPKEVYWDLIYFLNISVIASP